MREPNLWKSEKDFYLNVLVNPWYKLLVKLENLVSMETMKFYEAGNSFSYNVTPVSNCNLKKTYSNQ